MKKFLNLNTLYIVAFIIALGAFFIPWAVTLYKFQTLGIHSFTNDIESYHNIAHPLDGEYTIEIDLNHLENNEGKVLFDDGENQIYVSKVIAHHPKEFELFFRSNGNASLGGASIVSGVEYIHNIDGLTSEFKAKAEATYRDDTFKLSPSEYSGINYNNADEFGFYLDLPNDIVLDDEGMVVVAVTNLYLNLWAKK
ncbi:hypothetical protein E2R51_12075 [Jeotgalibacillus sp. S-D1]|uniref:hypothetical protein n=1 Tax=Jeotgalibacillus sp. S-D1 TaxID=2552189 RepID=UPI00105936F4|nr:hypothetical protein [Jeotgalibacillus sp. S-D1]TDL31947.1 hypothetical protein E2R51_12075 [Jeotgalibacillus sp. S-D1]